MLDVFRKFLSGPDNEDNNDTQSVLSADESMVTDIEGVVSQHDATTVPTDVAQSNKASTAGLWSRSTLPDLLVQALPDVDIHAPNVLIIGAQSSGKTKMIISLLFLYLMNDTSFDDAMGMSLLRLLRTGRSTVTRRPTTVNFIHSSAKTLQIYLSFQQHKDIPYGSPQYEVLMTQLTEVVSGNDVFSEEVEIKLVSNNVPNMRFTDMPGLTSKDRCFTDTPLQTVKERVMEMIADVNNTIVVVEQASIEDYQTSLVTPLLREIQQSSRPDIFDHSVLVISKCDQVSASVQRDHVVPMIYKTSEQIALFPFKHVVGVVNKADGDPETQEISHFQQFREIFQRTRHEEMHLFEHAIPAQISYKLNFQQNCTTKGVFHCMDRIFHAKLLTSIQEGITNIKHTLNQHEEQMRTFLAPCPSMYVEMLSAAEQRQTPFERKHFLRDTIMEEFRHNSKEVIKQLLQGQEIHSAVIVLPTQLQAILPNADVTVMEYLLQEVMATWPVSYSLGDIDTSMIIREKYELFSYILLQFVQNIAQKLLALIPMNTEGAQAQQQVSEAGLLLTSRYSPFHRIDRFHKLCHDLRSKLSLLITEATNKTSERIKEYLHLIYVQEEAQGALHRVRMLKLLTETRHVVITNMFATLSAGLASIYPPWHLSPTTTYFTEDDLFSKLRHEMNARRERLLLQNQILDMCRDTLTHVSEPSTMLMEEENSVDDSSAREERLRDVLVRGSAYLLQMKQWNEQFQVLQSASSSSGSANATSIPLVLSPLGEEVDEVRRQLVDIQWEHRFWMDAYKLFEERRKQAEVEANRLKQAEQQKQHQAPVPPADDQETSFEQDDIRASKTTTNSKNKKMKKPRKSYETRDSDNTGDDTMDDMDENQYSQYATCRESATDYMRMDDDHSKASTPVSPAKSSGWNFVSSIVSNILSPSRTTSTSATAPPVTLNVKASPLIPSSGGRLSNTSTSTTSKTGTTTLPSGIKSNSEDIYRQAPTSIVGKAITPTPPARTSSSSASKQPIVNIHLPRYNSTSITAAAGSSSSAKKSKRQLGDSEDEQYEALSQRANVDSSGSKRVKHEDYDYTASKKSPTPSSSSNAVRTGAGSASKSSAYHSDKADDFKSPPGNDAKSYGAFSSKSSSTSGDIFSRMSAKKQTLSQHLQEYGSAQKPIDLDDIDFFAKIPSSQR